MTKEFIISIVSICISFTLLIYTIISNKERYKLAKDLYDKIICWHSKVVEIIIYLRLNPNCQEKKEYLAKLSMLIEEGRFYYPNIDKKDGHGKNKLCANQGHRHVVLDILVLLYNRFQNDKYNEEEIKNLQKQFTSFVITSVDVGSFKKRITKNTKMLQFDYSYYDIKNKSNLDY